MVKSRGHTGDCRRGVCHDVAQHLLMAALLRCVTRHRCSHHKATGLQGLFKRCLVIDSHWLSAFTEWSSNLICWKIKRAGIGMLKGFQTARWFVCYKTEKTNKPQNHFNFYDYVISTMTWQETWNRKYIFCLFFHVFQLINVPFVIRQCRESGAFQWTYRASSPGCYYTSFLTGNTPPAPLTLTSALK